MKATHFCLRLSESKTATEVNWRTTKIMKNELRVGAVFQTCFCPLAPEAASISAGNCRLNDSILQSLRGGLRGTARADDAALLT